MKKLLVLTLLMCAAPVIAVGNGADALYIKVTLVTGERSRDSNSSTTTITITGSALTYEKTFHGRGGSRTPERKEFKLKNADKAKLTALITNHNLLRTEQIEREENSSGIRRYFSLSVETSINHRKGFIHIKGPKDATDIKDEKLYKDALPLVEEIYRMLHSADKTIVYQPSID
jgi:hypothetical protein